MNFTVIVDDQGSTHTYNCTSRIDAEVLFKAMLVYISGRVTVWSGLDCIGTNATYDCDTRADAERISLR